MNTYYFSAATEALLTALISSGKYANVIGPAQGRAAIVAGTGPDGLPQAAIPEAGNPALWYVSIRTDSTIIPPEGVTEDDVNGQAVLGVWA